MTVLYKYQEAVVVQKTFLILFILLLGLLSESCSKDVVLISSCTLRLKSTACIYLANSHGAALNMQYFLPSRKFKIAHSFPICTLSLPNVTGFVRCPPVLSNTRIWVVLVWTLVSIA
jgi:hypothetical protein